MQQTAVEFDERQKKSLVIILDDTAASYISRQQLEPNSYITQLLLEEKQRQQKGEKRSSRTIIEATPDTSGYPQTLQRT